MPRAKSTSDMVTLPTLDAADRPSTVSPKKKRNKASSANDGTISFADFLSVIGPSLLNHSHESKVKTVFSKHTGGQNTATFDAFVAMLEELSPVATVRQNLWAAACKVKAANKIGAGTGSARGSVAAGGAGSDKVVAGEDQSKLIATLRAKIRDLEAQATQAKHSLKLESELHALRRQNAALRKEAASAVSKAYEIKEQTEADVKARGAPHVRLLNKLIADKDARLEAKAAEIDHLKQKLEASEKIYLDETKKLKDQVTRMNKKLGPSEESAAELLAETMRQLHDLRSGLLVRAFDKPDELRDAPTLEKSPEKEAHHSSVTATERKDGVDVKAAQHSKVTKPESIASRRPPAASAATATETSTATTVKKAAPPPAESALAAAQPKEIQQDQQQKQHQEEKGAQQQKVEEPQKQQKQVPEKLISLSSANGGFDHVSRHRQSRDIARDERTFVRPRYAAWTVDPA